MKKKVGILYLIIMSIAFTTGLSTAKAVEFQEEYIDGANRKVVTAHFNNPQYSASIKHLANSTHGYKGLNGNYASGIVSTHAMSVTFLDGTPAGAYCAWYENQTPTTGDYKFYALTDKEFPQRYAVGAASIINADITSYGKTCYNYESHGETNGNHILTADDCQRAIKTTALNLYLSLREVNAGKKCNGGSSDRLNGAIKKWVQLSIFKDYTLQEMLEAYERGYLGSEQNKENEYWKEVARLVKNAMAQDEAYVKNRPTLKFVEDENVFTISKDGNYYEKYYTVKSNYKLQKNSLTAIVEGISKNEYSVSRTSDNTIKVSIKKDIYEANTDKIKVVATAKVEYFKKLNIFTSGDNRCTFQDIIFILPDIGIESVEVSTNPEPPDLLKTCYRYKTVCDNTPCEKTNAANKRNCTSTVETYYSTACDSKDIGIKPTGKYTTTLIDGVCNLYCTEKATASYPGRVRPAITIETNLVWPTSGLKSPYPLKTNSEMTCTIEMNNGGAVTSACQEAARKVKYVNGDNSSSVRYNDTIDDDNKVALKQNCSSETIVNGAKVTINNNCSYSLENEHNMINKETLEFVAIASVEASKAVTNYILISKFHGVLPISGFNWTDDKAFSNVVFAKSYSLGIENLSLGYNNDFRELLNKTGYTCDYKITTDISGDCTCPPGSKYSGLDIYGNEKDPAKTCAEAIETYCNKDLWCTKEDDTRVNITRCIDEGKSIEACYEEVGCVKNSRLCPPESSHPDRSYKACMAGGGTEQECIQEVCYDPCIGPNCEYKCPQNTPKAGMDISDCVTNYRVQYNYTEAYNTCKKLLCNDNRGDINIIYRTISLENPFPSMDADKRVNQRDLKVGMFNDTIKGRYPGANWNSVTLVHNKILNNRGYDGSAIYKEAKPLYTINLDAKAIKEIRNYNKKQVKQGGYADFELTCTDGAYCISKFLHENKITTSKGEPILDSGNSTCSIASDKNSFISCYTHK